LVTKTAVLTSTNKKNFITHIKTTKKTVRIGVVAKYLSNVDTYLSVFEAIKAAAWKHDLDADIVWIDAEKVEHNTDLLEGFDGIVVPGGFGARGIEGKIKAAQFARTHKVPYLGLCLGMQVAVIEFARHVLSNNAAHSTEMVEDTLHPVIHIMKDQVGVKLGGTMRLGNYKTVIDKNSRSFLAYGATEVDERHRHRYEFNDEFVDAYERKGFVISARSVKENLAEIIELSASIHPFYVGTQGHPEYKSRPNKPHPLFIEFLNAAKKSS
jgi:CTP synthase